MAQMRAGTFEVEAKDDGSIVTAIDRDAEQQLRSALLAAFPDDAFLGEESGETPGVSGWRWIVDPVDGTASLARGVPLFGTLVGLEQDGTPVAGVAALPGLGECVWAGEGLGAWHSIDDGPPVAAAVSAATTLGDALVCTTSFDYFRDAGASDAHDRLVRAVGSMRGWSDASAMLLLVTGRVDAVVEPVLRPWDIVPWRTILKAAGGRFTPWAQGGVASAPSIHDSLVEVVGEGDYHVAP